ncbi:LON peptidase substrate-binding domain-containing protein [Chondromyces crocatus]|uniref:ATP-dependent protease n=1 Tax=Chondromyces crocatus TaxID=52 RepID=A0A0K1E809_CHOCO|nr:LON peptidase substrate-binding domain-containing protein [Chondromyces crocatus]AKT36994.1 ATP-dependent protease [Chondromyces crocatus]
MTTPATPPTDLAAALSRLPLFPLPQVVLFPGALLPLHVFEPRYKTLVRDALATHRCLSVVLIADPNRVDEHGHPAIHHVAGVGEIIEHVELPGGRYNILVRGRARVRLAEQPFIPPYRTAQATLLEDRGGAIDPTAQAALLSTASAYAAMVRDQDQSFDLRLPPDASLGLSADLCAHYLLLDPSERQTALETLEVDARVQQVTDALALQRLSLAQASRALN